MGPHEWSANTGKLLGRAKAEARLLEGQGWHTIHLPVGSRTGAELAKFLEGELQQYGLDVRLTAGKQGSRERSGRKGGVGSARPAESPLNLQMSRDAVALPSSPGPIQSATALPAGSVESSMRPLSVVDRRAPRLQLHVLPSGRSAALGLLR
jgi:hypothetical protein